MKISIIGSTHPGYVASKTEFDIFSGKTAGVCYMPNSFEDLLHEDKQKTEKRVAQTKISGHHSVYDHDIINFYLEDIPKALAMVLNNEKMYTTSEKSARYTKMVLKKKEQLLYDKWLDIFKTKISKKYIDIYPDFFSKSKIEKLAQENARYLISVFTPTSMVYTTTYRQLNYLYEFFLKMIEKKDKNNFEKLLSPSIKQFCKLIKNNSLYIDDFMLNNKGRKISLLEDNSKVVEYFGDVYCTCYKGSFAQFAQAQRHRTLNYNFSFLSQNQFYVPPLIRDDKKLVEEWLEDCSSQAKVFPQGMLVNICEMGTFDNFVLKMMERKCTFAQLEINQQTNDTLKKYISFLQKSNHPRASELKLYSKGSRCTFPAFKCTAPCNFKEGVLETRLI